ncbi:HesA/MoeB/ThiF family protein [Streptococcus suis]|uniref:HesA/MoeB/ThiF family protein n=1 Tax=Streptococcus suis TaxID=1307 RepID=UPI00209AB283|nr:ThiF family adenylyltransferase [Streptococcus suis]MCO8214238.1 ThiF family adenylyltransferase [Streptococcus suis]HEM3439607.1 ThiF family adenylyltransferase [Streptococcus suis]
MWKIQHSFHFEHKNDSLFVQSDWKKYKLRISIENSKIIYGVLQKLRYKSFNSLSEFKKIIRRYTSLSNSEKLLNLLIEKEILVNIPVHASNLKFGRQENFFRNFESNGISAQQLNKELQSKTVLIVGLGGYGTNTAMLFARMGIKRLVLIDADTIESTNINRQILYDEVDVGRKKVIVCKEKIKRIDNSIDVECYDTFIKSEEQMIQLLDNVDIVMNSAGYYNINKDSEFVTHFILEACKSRGVPVLNYTGSFIGPITYINYPDVYYTFVSNSLVKSTLINQEIEREINDCNSAFIPRITISCSIAVWEAVRFLINLPRDIDLEKNVIIIDTVSYVNHRIITVVE